MQACWVISILKKSNLFPSHKFDFPFGKNLASLPLIADPSFLSELGTAIEKSAKFSHTTLSAGLHIHILNRSLKRVEKEKVYHERVLFPQVIDRSPFRGLLDLEPVGICSWENGLRARV